MRLARSIPLLPLAALAWAGCASTHTASTPTLTAVTPATRRGGALSSDERVRHVLNRLAFGPRPGDEAAVRAIGVERWIARQLEPDSIDDGDVDTVLAHFPTTSLALADAAQLYARPAALRAAPHPDPTPRLPMTPCADRSATTLAHLEARDDSLVLTQAERAGSRLLTDLQATKLARAVVSRRQLQEVMVDFWENHFSVYSGKGPERYLLLSFDRDVIRPHALGRFHDVLVAVARSPAMLYYLDNWQSAAEPERPTLGPRGRGARRGINENFGRELLELHTLGVDGGYTQQDVINVARIFTGWSVRRPQQGGDFEFHDWAHDYGEKVVMGVMFPAGRGRDEGVRLLKLLANYPATMHHVSRRLCQRFVNDDPPDGCVDDAVTAWKRSDGDIREVLRAIFRSPDFWAPENVRAKIKTPLEFVVSAARAVGGDPDTTPRLAQVVARLGEPLFLHVAPDGYPEREDAWVNSGALLDRMNAAVALAAGRLPGVAVSLDSIVPATPDAERLIAQANAAVLSGTMSENTKQVIRRQISDISDPLQARALAIGLAIGGPEFQRQ